MLKLLNIKKDYLAGENTVHALKGVNLEFRKSEFVSILGPSGCGKTTMLNIVGGLDKYSDGDLIINGISTKEYKDRDWDAYRNHSIGFVFQSYNLIPHQTVLQNVELALALSGVSKKERKEKAIKALKSVGLEKQTHKRPSELSGGQMQRVAIARAIVNDPDIILADEPTGALDTETSIQVLDILKEISKDKLVIMVTHNPELADKYSTRIVRMVDGLITSDSAPLSKKEIEAEMKHDQQVIEQNKIKKVKKKAKKPSMSIWTSFSLSLKNLFTKKGRTILTTFAGSIGIIGIALIYAVSQGTTNYINLVQEDTLSSYPITLQAEYMDFGALMQSFIDSAEAKEEHDNDAVYEKSALYDLAKALNSSQAKKNDLQSFKAFIETELKKEDGKFKDILTGVQYTYDFDMNVFTESVDGKKIIESDTQKLMNELLSKHMGGVSVGGTQGGSNSMMSSMPQMSAGAFTLWQEMLMGEDGKLINPLFEKQYDLLYGSWPNDKNEIVLVVDSNNEIDDMTLYALGLKSKAEIEAIIDAALTGAELPEKNEQWKTSYAEICSKSFKVIPASETYMYSDALGMYIKGDDSYLKYLYSSDEIGYNLKVSGIIKAKPDASSTILTGSIGYTRALTEDVIEKSKSLPIVEAQLNSKDYDILTNKPFKESADKYTEVEKALMFVKYLNSLKTTEEKALFYDKMANVVPIDVLNGWKETPLETAKESVKTAIKMQFKIEDAEANNYLSYMSNDDILTYYIEINTEMYRQMYVAPALKNLSNEQKAALVDLEKNKNDNISEKARYFDETTDFSDSTYEDNLRKLGYVDMNVPSTINLYASTFENKDKIDEIINEYNKTVDENSQISYVDYVGILLSSITTIIDAITYVLIAFVAVSLVVSSIMIGVITLISVQERTKEIGILRSIGASKRNVSSMFNAETLIIGFASGLMGVLITCLLCIPINFILAALTGMSTLKAVLPLPTAIILIVISMVLNLISGIIPSRSASKKDPVVALRTE